MEQFEWGEAFRLTVENFVERASAYAPNLLAALLIISVGWVLARLFRLVCRKLAKVGVATVARNQQIKQTIERTGLDEQIPRVTGAIIYWVVLLFFISVAAERLRLEVATTIASTITLYLPKVLIAGVIIAVFLVAGSIVNNIIKKSITSVGGSYSHMVGRMAQFLIISLGVIIGAGELGIQSGFLTAIVAIILGSILGGAALAIGLGSGLAVSNIVSAHYLNRVYKVGQLISIGDTQGRIVAINQTGFLLDTERGQLLVPGRRFSKEASLLIKE